MRQQTLEWPVASVADAPSDGRPAEVLVRLWEEAERTIAARRPPNPTPRQAHPTAQLARVRYDYD